MPDDYWATGMLMAVYQSIGDTDNIRRTAKETVARTDKLIAQDPINGSAIGFTIGALISLGESERAHAMIERALLLDPDNKNMRYNLACAFLDLGDTEAALDTLQSIFETLSIEVIHWAKTDPDLDEVRDNPRFKSMMATAEARLAKTAG